MLEALTLPGLIYFTFIFLAALGVLQIAAALNSLRGLLLVRNKFLSILIGIVLVAGAFVWYLNLTNGFLLAKIEGEQQGILFLLGSSAALLVTLILASLFHWNRSMPSLQETNGLDALKEMTYWQVLRVQLRGKAREKATSKPPKLRR